MLPQKIPQQSQREYVYAVLCRELNTVKIGFSLNPERRLKSLQDSSPARLELLGYCEGSMATEKRAHLELSNARKTGEWFFLTPEVTALVEQIVSQSNLARYLDQKAETRMKELKAQVFALNEQLTQEEKLKMAKTNKELETKRMLLDEDQPRNEFPYQPAYDFLPPKTLRSRGGEQLSAEVSSQLCAARGLLWEKFKTLKFAETEYYTPDQCAKVFSITIYEVNSLMDKRILPHVCVTPRIRRIPYDIIAMVNELGLNSFIRPSEAQ